MNEEDKTKLLAGLFMLRAGLSAVVSERELMKDAERRYGWYESVGVQAAAAEQKAPAGEWQRLRREERYRKPFARADKFAYAGDFCFYATIFFVIVGFVGFVLFLCGGTIFSSLTGDFGRRYPYDVASFVMIAAGCVGFGASGVLCAVFGRRQNAVLREIAAQAKKEETGLHRLLADGLYQGLVQTFSGLLDAERWGCTDELIFLIGGARAESVSEAFLKIRTDGASGAVAGAYVSRAAGSGLQEYEELAKEYCAKLADAGERAIQVAGEAAGDATERLREMTEFGHMVAALQLKAATSSVVLAALATG